PAGGVIAGAEHEHAEVHLAPLRRHGEYRPYFFAADMSRLWLTTAVCDAGPRRIGFEMCTSTVGDFTCEMAATSAGSPCRGSRELWSSSSSPSSETSHTPWRRRRPSASRVHCR